MSFTEQRDSDLLIMKKLDDISLFNFCTTNKYTRDLCQNEDFWRGRFYEKYGEEAPKYKPKDRNWKNHYLQVFIDLDKFSKDPMKFLDNIYWTSKGMENSYYKEKSGKLVPLNSAPEWVLNNLWLLDLGSNITIHSRYDPTKKDTFSHLTPIQLLNIIGEEYFSKNVPPKYIHQFVKFEDGYIPDIQNL